mgnify:CR=1 FL=1
MKRYIPILILAASLTACVKQAAIPLGNDLAEIDVSTSAVYRRAGAQEFALKKAAQTTLDYGYDRFMVVQNNGWTELNAGGTSYGALNGNAVGFSGQGGSVSGTSRSPEIKMIIRMLHNSDRGAEKAVDAHTVLKQ